MLDLQKAGIFKRFSAFLCDILIFFILTVALLLLGSTITGYDGYLEKIDTSRTEYEEKYGKDIIYAEDVDALTDEQKALYDEAEKEIRGDAELNFANDMVQNLSLVLPSISLLLSFLVLEFIVPLCFKNGQTFGKKIFGIGVMRTNGTRLTPQLLFVRSILGKYTMETMVPVFILAFVLLGIISGFIGIGVVIAIVILNVVVMCVTKTNSTIHDLLAYTVTVDLASQRIFENDEELIEYKKKLHAEAVEAADRERF